MTGQLLERFHTWLCEEADGEPLCWCTRTPEALHELTCYCKPIITELTIIVGLAARGIANAICIQVADVGPPSLLLLFLKLFSKIIFPLCCRYT
jgi:hypothetical protein